MIFYSLGNSEAAQILEQKLNNCSKSSAAKVMRLFNRFCKGLNHLSTIKDKELRDYMSKLWLHDHLRQSDFSDSDYELPVTYIKNVIHAKYTTWIKNN